MKRKRYNTDHERLQGWLDALPIYNYANIALEDIKSKRDLRCACIQRNINTDGFLVGADYIRALKNIAVDEECALCLEQFRKNDKVVIMLCNHEYHYSCLQKAILSEFEQTNNIPRCPLCRVPIKVIY